MRSELSIINGLTTNILVGQTEPQDRVSPSFIDALGVSSYFAFSDHSAGLI